MERETRRRKTENRRKEETIENEREGERERDGEEEKETQRRMDRDGEIGVCIYGRYIARLAEGTS